MSAIESGARTECRHRSSSRRNGFSLIELMIAMAIIGVISTVAIPNFMALQARSVRAEAQTVLSSIAKAERAYFIERGTYTDDLGLLGFTLSGTPRFLYGFTSDAMPAGSGRNDTAELRALGGGGPFSVELMVDAFGSPLADADLPNAQVTASTFRIGAAANLDRDPNLDRWTFDNDGVMVNITSDLDD